MSITFDSLKFVDALEQAQLPREQARAIVEVVRNSHDAADVATKNDILKLDAKIDLVRSDLRGDIHLLRWMMGVTLAGVGAIFAKLFF